jgi:secondary thiamine-phosphate synthase enzyme
MDFRGETHREAFRIMRQWSHRLNLQTKGRGLQEITGEVVEWLKKSGAESGLLTLFCRHTSASLLIQENADPNVRRDLEAYFERIAPEDPHAYAHDDEGPDDMPSHLRTALTGTSLSIPVTARRMALGTWQGIYLFEHRRIPHMREIALHLIGE